MTPLIIWSIVIILIFAVLLLPIRFFFSYDEGVITNWFSIYNIKIKFRKKEKEQKEIDIKEEPVTQNEKSPLNILKITHKNFSDIMLLVHKFSKKVLKSIIVENFTVNIIESTGDSASTAISFGYKSWIINWFSAILGNIFTVKKLKIDINPDFTEKEKKTFLSILVRVRLIRIINILFVLVFNYKMILNLVKKYKED